MRRLVAADGRSVNKLACDAHARWPGRSKDAWRKVIQRVLDGPRPEMDSVAALAELLGADVSKLTGQAYNLPSRPTASTLIEFTFEVASVDYQCSETATVGDWLGLSDAEVSAMTWLEVERAIHDAAVAWASEQSSSGWGPG